MRYLLVCFSLLMSCDLGISKEGQTVDLFGLNSLNKKAVKNDSISKDHSSVLIENNGETFTEKIDIPTQLLNSSIVVFVYDVNDNLIAQGSGFFIKENLIITNHHVIDNASQVVIKLNNLGVTANAQLINVDEYNDLAVLKTDFTSTNFIDVDSSINDSRIGDPIYVAGTPKGLEGTLSTGIISAHRKATNSDPQLIQISAAISPGSSGGPVVCKNTGRLIGVACSGLESGNDLYFAVPAKKVKDLIN